MPDEHTTDEADLGARDRAQPNRIGRAVNRRADGDAHTDEEEREHLLDEVADEDDQAPPSSAEA